MQGYKVKEKTAIVPPVSKLSGHPAKFQNLYIWKVYTISFLKIKLFLVLHLTCFIHLWYGYLHNTGPV